MSWHISIFTRDGKTLLFAAKCGDRREAVSLATEARSLRPSALIYLRDPRGEVSSWD